VRLRAPLPHSEAARDRCILLPLYSGMGDDTVHAVAGALAEALAGRPALPLSA
jgi:perosamine synthetase